MSVVDLNEELNIDEWTKRRISEIVHSSWVTVSDPWFSRYPNDPSPTSPFAVEKEKQDVGDDHEESNADGDSIVWSAAFGSRGLGRNRLIEFEFTGERFTMLQNALTFIAKQLPEELAISDLRIELENDLGLWIFDRPGTLQAYDLRSQNWIPVNSTSNATQNIIGMALKIHSDIRSSGNNVIAVGDEIDRGLHTMAVNGLYKMLADSIPTSFITSHSPVALSTKLGERLHVHRGVSGEVLVSSINNKDFLSTTSSNLGVRVNELIGMIDLVVAVEGLHDQIVLNHFIKLDERLSNSNILVISLAGVNNATNLLDADFLLSFTDLRILALADNTSKTELELTRIDTMEKLSSGQAASNIARSLRRRAKELKDQKWHEQYCMMELLAVAAERNLISRIRTSGHIYADIETALDPKFFGLDKDWLELESEYQSFKSDPSAKGRNFKDFLRSSYKVSITRETINAALSMTEEAPSGIKLVLDDIVTNAYQTDLLQNLP
jgi:hypothetical protein